MNQQPVILDYAEETKGASPTLYEQNQERKRIVKNLIDPTNKLSDDQISLFLMVSKERNLKPELRQIYAVPRYNRNSGRNEMTIQVSIDGFRLIAERTGKYSPGKPTVFHTDEKGNLTGATVYVKKLTNDGTWHEVSATAFLAEYKPSGDNSFWNKMPSVMIEKCAEARALRRAFPGDFSGIYCEDEMEQAKEDASIKKPVSQTISPDKVAEIENFLNGHVEIKEQLLTLCNVPSLDEIKESQLEACRRFVAKKIREKTQVNEEQNDTTEP